MDGPSTVQLERKGLDQAFLEAGEVIEVCGVMNGTVLITSDGKKRVWSDYGQMQKCVSPEEQGSLIR